MVSARRKAKKNKSNLIFQDFSAKTLNQQSFYDSIMKNVVSIALGPAGVGKTLVALHASIDLLLNGDIERIIYLRSDVGLEFQRKRGALPGTLGEKIAPLITPLKDNLPCIIHNPNALELLMGSGKIEPTFLEDIRGRSFNRCVIIADEAQNMLPSNVKTILTRIGEESKAILIGDTSQADMEVFRKSNGLLDCYKRIGHFNKIGTVKFEIEDIVRNGILKDILLAYDNVQ